MTNLQVLEAAPAREERRASVPVIDVSAFRDGTADRKRDIAEQVGAACRSIGFFVITGHGVPMDLVQRVGRASRTFYDLPIEEKLKTTSPRRGYFPMGRQAVAQSMGGQKTVPDSHEIFAMGREHTDPSNPYYTAPRAQQVFSPNVWPKEPDDFKGAWLDYQAEMERLAKMMMGIFEMALDLPQGWFWPHFDKHMSTMAAINYPSQDSPPPPGQNRLGGHTDFGAFTLLMKADNKPGGLEVQAKDGVWEAVPVVPDAYIVNVGDMLKRWTNDLWESSLHRVTGAPFEAGVDSRRQSLVFFFHPNHDVVIEPLPGRDIGEPKYPPISAGELLVTRIDAMRNTAPKT